MGRWNQEAPWISLAKLSSQSLTFIISEKAWVKIGGGKPSEWTLSVNLWPLYTHTYETTHTFTYLTLKHWHRIRTNLTRCQFIIKTFDGSIKLSAAQSHQLCMFYIILLLKNMSVWTLSHSRYVTMTTWFLKAYGYVLFRQYKLWGPEVL